MSENTPETPPTPPSKPAPASGIASLCSTLTQQCSKVPLKLCGGIAAGVALVIALPVCCGGGSISSDDDFMAFYDGKVDAYKGENKKVWRSFKRHRSETLRALLGADGGDVNEAFFAAALFDSSAALDYLVEEKGFKPDAYCLRRLARIGCADMCKQLMEDYGAKPDAGTLAAAAFGGSAELCRYLCEKQGLDAAKLPNLVDVLNCDEEALKRAAEEISVLTGDEITPEELAKGQLEAVTFFVESGAPITSPKAVKQLEERFSNKPVIEFLRQQIAAKTPPPAPSESEQPIVVEEVKPYDFTPFFAQMEAASDRDAYIAVMQQMSRLPEYRRFRVGEVVLPKGLAFEELSADEASKSSWWVSPSEVEILPTEETVKFFNEELYPRYKAFFAKFATAERTKTATVPIQAAQGEGSWTRNKYGALAMLAKPANAIFGNRGFKVVLMKVEETDLSKLTVGSTVNCEVTVFDLPEAYKSCAEAQATNYTDAEVRIWLKDAATDQRTENYVTMDMDIGRTMHTPNSKALIIAGFGAGAARSGDIFVKVRRKQGRVWWREDNDVKKPENLSFEVAMRDTYELAADAVRKKREQEAEKARREREYEEERRRREEEANSPGYFD